VDEAGTHGLQPNSFMFDAAVKAAGKNRQQLRMLEEKFRPMSASSQQPAAQDLRGGGLSGRGGQRRGELKSRGGLQGSAGRQGSGGGGGAGRGQKVSGGGYARPDTRANEEAKIRGSVGLRQKQTEEGSSALSASEVLVTDKNPSSSASSARPVIEKPDDFWRL